MQYSIYTIYLSGWANVKCSHSVRELISMKILLDYGSRHMATNKLNFHANALDIKVKKTMFRNSRENDDHLKCQPMVLTYDICICQK